MIGEKISQVNTADLTINKKKMKKPATLNGFRFTKI